MKTISPEELSQLDEKDVRRIVEHLSEVSISEPAMLGRSPEFYEEAFETNRLVLMVERKFGKVLGSGLLLPLGDDWAEVSGVHVTEEARWHGLGSEIVEGVKKLANEHGVKPLLTMKPNVHGSEGMVLEAVKNGLVPVSFEYLETSPEAYRSCCVCHDQNGSPECPDRNVSCVLGVDFKSSGAKEATIKFMKSPEFAKAASDDTLREKIITRVTNVLWK